MRGAIFGAVAATALLSGCTAVRQELRHPGGYFGDKLDHAMVDGRHSKRVQLARAALIIAMTARMATVTVRDGKEADAFVDYLGAAIDELNYTAANLYGSESSGAKACQIRADTATVAAPCQAYAANFESDLPLLEARIMRLMLAALPENRARRFLQDVGEGDVLGAAWSALRAAAEVTSGLRHASAVYRSGLEVFGAGCADAPTSDSVKSLEEFTVAKAATCLGLPKDRLQPSEPVAAKGQINRDAFHAFMLIAKTSCARLPLNTSTDLGTVAAQRNGQCAKIQFKPDNRPTAFQIGQAPAGQPAPPGSN